MSSSMLFRSLCRPSKILFESPHAQLTRKITTDPSLRKVTVDKISSRDPYVDYNSNGPIVSEFDPRIDDPEAGRLYHRFRYFSAPILKDTFYFIERQQDTIIQGIILEQKHSSGKEVHGAHRLDKRKLDKRKEDATSHLAETYGLDFEQLNKMTSMYMSRVDLKAGCYLIAIDEMEHSKPSSKDAPNPHGYLRSKSQTVAWKVEYDLEEDLEEKFRKEAENSMKAWIMRDNLKNMYDRTVWTKRSVRNKTKWEKVRTLLRRRMLFKPRKSKQQSTAAKIPAP